MLLNFLAAVLFTFGMSIGIIEKREQLYCGVQNIYHESRGESNLGQRAVANVVRNRVASEHYPNTICEVVWQPKQFSWTADEISDEPTNRKALVKAVWLHIISGMRDNTKGATHYYVHNIVDPFWAKEMVVTTVIGNHTFGYIPGGK